MSSGSLRRRAAPILVTALLVGPTVPTFASDGLRITTDYPSIAVEPGGSAAFAIELSAPSQRRVGLEVSRVPRGWDAVLRGGGAVIDEVFAGGGKPPEVRLEIDVPERARPGRHEIVVAATSSGVAHRLPVFVRVARAAGGEVGLVAEFPRLREAADSTFTFDLELANDTPQEAAFSLQAVGPPGWQVEARPSIEQQASTVTIGAGESASVQVEVDPPDDAPAGTYPIAVQASGGGGEARAELEVEITGNFALTLTTPDERLNADVQAGRTSEVTLVVVNDGTAPLADVRLSSSPPSDWRVEFEPETIEALRPGDRARVTAQITPSGDAIAGDYVVTLEADGGDASDEAELRTTVETSALWGAIGIGLIALVIGGLAYIFRRFGRR